MRLKYEDVLFDFTVNCNSPLVCGSLRLDHILYDEDRLQLTNVKVIDTDASDHNALSAGFKLKTFSV